MPYREPTFRELLAIYRNNAQPCVRAQFEEFKMLTRAEQLEFLFYTGVQMNGAMQGLHQRISEGQAMLPGERFDGGSGGSGGLH